MKLKVGLGRRTPSGSLRDYRSGQRLPSGAGALGTDFFAMEAPAWTQKDVDWFDHSRSDWDRVYQPDRIRLMVDEMRDLIALLERKTGRRFDEDRLAELMEKINEQESYIDEAAQMIGSTRPCPGGGPRGDPHI